jgi:hypothetical protein
METQTHTITAGILLAAFIIGGVKLGVSISKNEEFRPWEKYFGAIMAIVFFIIGLAIVTTHS